MAEQIKKGDVVQLKSGGPKMTVEKIEPWNGEQRAWCLWFDGKKKTNGVFSLESLEHTTESN